MKRDPKFRGKADKWERITWEEAYDMIDEKFTKIRDEYGGKAIIFASGTGRVTPPINARLGYALGSIQYSYFHSGQRVLRSPRCSREHHPGLLHLPRLLDAVPRPLRQSRMGRPEEHLRLGQQPAYRQC